MRKTPLLVLLVLSLVPVEIPAADIFPTNSVWRFRPGNTEASTPASTWRTIGFNDTNAGFANAPAPFWYGDAYSGGTQILNMQNSYTCIFLRKTFVVTNAAQIGLLRLGAVVDDGFIAWINGTEVKRFNVGPGEPTYQTLSTNAPEPVPFVIYNLPSPGSYLVTGTNVLTVQAFNTSSGSSDFGFDASLTALQNEAIPPTIVNVTPAPGTVPSLTSVAVTFSEAVSGVQADDFLVNGIPPAGVTVSGNTYTFTFAQPLYGTIFITWAAGHGIVDQALVPNSFNATGPGATWQYNLVDAIPPQVANRYPTAGLTVHTLSRIEITFSEDVLGVDPADLLINNQPATNLTQQPGGPFIFTFPQPLTGTVAVAWSPGHGITDASAIPNSFAGGSWSYTLDPNLPVANLIITEFLSANVSTNGLADEDGEQQEWIEIHNGGSTAVNLQNWSLSDDEALPGLWTFPARTLNPNQYLVVFASGKDRRSTNSAVPLHTNFKLSDNGEHLGLYSPDSPRLLISGFTPFPEQRNDISYGRDATNGLRYFATPTPGAANGLSTITGVCAAVHVNVQRGHFVTPFDLTLSTETAGAQLRYTMDGSEPTASSALYSSALRVTNTTLFRAAAFQPNMLPAKTVTHTYFFNLPANVRSLPVISIVTASNNLYGPSGILGINGGNYDTGPWQPNGPGDYHNPSQHGLAWERRTSVEWIQPEDNSGFQTDCGIRVQGSDYQRPRLSPSSKFSFRLYFRSDYGDGRLDYPLFPLTGVQRFDQLVLRAGFNEQYNPFIRDEIHRRLSSDMGSIASHGTLAVVFVNGVYYASSPWYNPCERVHEEFFQEHLGGGNDWDVVGPSWAQSAGIPGVVDGDRANFQSLVNYVNAQPVTSQIIYTNIARWLELTNFVDYCLLNAYAATGDWPANNWRAGKDRSKSGPWRFVVWDAEWGMGIYGRSVTINSFTETGGGPSDSGLGSIGSSEIAQLYNRLRASPEFRLLWADRVQKHFFNSGALTGANITNRFMELRDQLFPLMGEMDAAILNWARDRQPIFFGHMTPYGLTAYTNAPGFNQFGGRVAAGFNLVITNTGGTIYYTTNGSDPRVAFTGAVSPAALTYTGAVPLNTTVTIRSRAVTGGNWSALTEATFTVGALGIPLRITELMYNPSGGSLYEFLELQNTSGAAVDLSGMYFDGITFMFNEGTTLAGGARIVLGVNTDTNAWKAFYPGVNPGGWFSGNLNNAGERITLFDRVGNIITTVDYSDSNGWPTAADGGGRSIEVINPNGNPDEPANWKASATNNGTPGAVNSAPPAQLVYLNEIMAENDSAVNNGGTFPDWVELRNPGGSSVNLTGWSLTDDGNPRKFVFPATTLPAGSYLTIWCDATTNTTPGLHTGFSLNRAGENVFLYDANTNRIDALSFGAQLANYSVGRIGGNWTLTSPTPTAGNVAAPLALASYLAINEWLANPAPGNPDWIELFNRSTTAPISLAGVYLATSNSLHQFTSLSFVPPLGYLVLFADEAVGPDQLDLKLPATGDVIILSDATGSQIQKITYPAQTEGVSRGRLPDGGVSVINFPGSTSPGTTNYLSTYTGPVLNEVLARNKSVSVSGQIVDFIEIYNPTGGSFNLGGMSLGVNSPQAGEWVFPTNTTIAANSYLLIKCNGAAPAATNAGAFNTGESLDGESGGVYLFNPAHQLVNSIEYGVQVENLSIGLSAGQWRLLNSVTPGAANSAAAVLGLNTALRLNEWMAAPVTEADWFELFNTTNRPVDLSTISLSDDPSIAGQNKFRPAPLSFIGARGFVKWVADNNAGDGRNHVNFALAGAGDSTLIYNVNGANYLLVDAVGFGAQTPGVSEGSLPDGANNSVSFPDSPTPAASNYRVLQNVVINEALTHTDPPLEDAIELHNPTASPTSINGWYLSNTRDYLRKYQITNTAPIPAGGSVVIYEYQFNNASTNAFTLKAAYDDEIWLTVVTNGVETGERATVNFGASFNGVSFGRVVTSQGADFIPLSARTFGVDSPANVAQFRTGLGALNAPPVVGPIIINEIFYHPPGGTNGSEEFIELHNNTGSPVPLYDPAYPTNRWQLGGGIEFTFPASMSLAAHAHLLVVDFNPTNTALLTAFRQRYGINAGIPILGPFTGLLDNTADRVELYRPDAPQPPAAPDAGFVPYVIADRASYTDKAPWPGGAVDGGGLSLQRLAVNLYGNEPLNWGAATPTPGGSNGTTSPDTDKDGIPDAAEDLMGLDYNDPIDAALDNDLDGMTNLQEYLAGTDHEDEDSSLKFTKIAAGANLTLTFNAMAAKTYSVLWKNDLTETNWTKLTDVPASPTNAVKNVTDTLGNSATRFYQLMTPAQEP
jgi:hypothetical protein